MAEVLVVCRANLCRSPAVELMLRAALGPTSRIVVSSAGLRPAQGASVPSEVAEWMTTRGLDVSAHRPRGLRTGQVEAADLVVVMTRSQSSALLVDHPTALHRTVLLTELGDRVVVEDPDGSGGLIVRRRSRERGADIPDPFGRPADEVAVILEAAEAAVHRGVPALS